MALFPNSIRAVTALLWSRESRRNGLMFVYIFLVILAVTLVKPVGTALFLNRAGIKALPLVYIMVAVLSFFAVYVYDSLGRVFHTTSLIRPTLVITASCLGAFWLYLQDGLQSDWFFYVLYIWTALFPVVLSSQYWLLAGRIMDTHAAKRNFGLWGAGAIAGGAVGGYMASILAPVIGAANLLPIAGLLLVGTVFVVSLLIKGSLPLGLRIRTGRRRPRSHLKIKPDSGFRLVLGSRHLTLLGLIVAVVVVVARLIDYQYGAIASLRFPNPDSLTAFFGFWMSAVAVTSFVAQIFLTRKVVDTLGPAWLLMVLPAAVILGASSIIFAPGLAAVIIAKMATGSFLNSTNKSGVELLALPIRQSIRNRAKPFIDVFVDNAATGFGGLLLIVLTRMLGFSVSELSIVVLVLVAIWLYLIIRVRKEYIQSFRTAIRSPAAETPSSRTDEDDARIVRSLIRGLPSYDNRQTVFLLKVLMDGENKDFALRARALLNHESSLVRLFVLRLLVSHPEEDFGTWVKPLTEDPDAEVRIEAVHYMCLKSKQPESQLQKFLDSADTKVRSAALLCVATETGKASTGPMRKYLVSAHDKLRDEMNQSEKGSHEVKLITLRVVALAKTPELFSFVQPLLEDSSKEVQKEAITCAGAIRFAPLIPILIGKLNDKELRRGAGAALANYGEEVIPQIKKAIYDSKSSLAVRSALITSLGAIQSQSSADLLIELLGPNGHDALDSVTVIALRKLRNCSISLTLPKGEVEKRIYDEIDYFSTLHSVFLQQDAILLREVQVISGADAHMISHRRLLVRALREKLELSMGKAFKLLSLVHGGRDMDHALLALKSTDSTLRAYAVEFLANVLPARTRRRLMPAIEQYTLDSDKTDYGEVLGPRSEAALLDSVAAGSDSWLKLSTLR